MDVLAAAFAPEVGICCRGSPATEPRMEMLSEGAGEKAEATLVGEFVCDDGVGRFLGDVADL